MRHLHYYFCFLLWLMDQIFPPASKNSVSLWLYISLPLTMHLTSRFKYNSPPATVPILWQLILKVFGGFFKKIFSTYVVALKLSHMDFTNAFIKPWLLQAQIKSLIVNLTVGVLTKQVGTHFVAHWYRGNTILIFTGFHTCRFVSHLSYT